MQLNSDTRSYIEKLGSSYFSLVGWRDMWAFIFQRNGREKKAFAESHRKSPEFNIWANDVLIRTSIKRQWDLYSHCLWEENASTSRRREFCDKFDGYEGVCRCEQLTSLTAMKSFKYLKFILQCNDQQGSLCRINFRIPWNTKNANVFRSLDGIYRNSSKYLANFITLIGLTDALSKEVICTIPFWYLNCIGSQYLLRCFR